MYAVGISIIGSRGNGLPGVCERRSGAAGGCGRGGLLVAVSDFLLVVVGAGATDVVIHSRVLGGVALASVVGLAGGRVLGQTVGLGQVLVLVASEPGEEAASAGAGARRVVVLGAGTEALLLAVVAKQDDFHEHGDEEEEAIILMVS